MTVSIPRESEWLSSERMSDDEGDTDSDGDMGEPPVHPVPTMQGAFEESMAETLEEAEDPDAPDRMSIADSVSRRKTLLEQEEYERTVAGRWKQKPGEKFHPLWKLVAQISFGMHLLQQGMAKSDEEVIKILQTHVDEIDGFLERTTEDFDLAQNDIDERIRYLRLPLEHGGVFDTMLNDRSFRVAIVEGNEKIEHIIDRTAAAMNDALKDVQKGLDATRELAKYLTRVDKDWDDRTEEHDSVYLAMIGNTEGWTRAFLTLQSKGNHLRKGLVQLGGIVAEMQRKAGAASRRNLAPKPAQGRYHVEPKTSTTPQGSISPKSPRKPLPTAPNAEAKAARVPKDASPLHHPSSRKHSSSSQQTVLGQQSSVRQFSSPTKVPDPGQHPALRQHASSPQSRSPGQQSNFRRQSESSQRQDSAQDASPKQYQSPAQHDNSRRRVPSADWNSPGQDEKLILRGSSNDWAQNPMASPLIEHAMSARRVSPVMRMHSTDRVPLTISPEPPMPVKASDPKPPTVKSPVPERSVERTLSRRRPSNERKSSVSQELPPVTDDRKQQHATNEGNANDSTIERKRSGPDLPIQSPTEHEPPPPSKSPTVKHMPSHRITVLSTTSDYSRGPTSPRGSVESPVTRETSPVLHRNSQGPAPNHKSYGSISFLPMHPLLSPLEDSSDWAADAEREFERRTSDTPKVPAPAPIPGPQPIPALDDSEGAVNASHPLLLAERHTRFAPRTNASNSRTGRDLPLRHYHSQEVVRRSIFSPSDEKEVFVPPKRSSSLVWDQSYRASAAMNSSLSLPLASTKLSPPPDSSSAAPSPLNVTQTQRSLTPQPANVLKSSKASIVEVPSSESVSTATSPSHNATPPAISRIRSSIPQSKSTPNLAITEHSPSDEPASAARYNTSATNNTPIYFNPVSSTALIDFLATTPPPSPGRRARSPVKPADKEKHGPADKHSGPFSIFPSSFRPSSPGVRALASLNIPRDGQKAIPARGATSASPNENKKGFKKFFGGGGTKKAKGTKQDGMQELGLVIPEHERYRTKKRTGMKGHKKGGSKDEEEVKVKKEGTSGEDGGFMGVGKDGVWISRKNFLKT